MRLGITFFLLLTLGLSAATLHPESVAAWDNYVTSAEAKLENRTRQNATFLWLDESPKRRSQVQAGELVVSETNSGVNKKVPYAQIHDWTGAAFIPGTSIEDVMSVLRHYSSYQEYYRPAVVTSKTLAQEGGHDRFSVLLVNSSVLIKTAVETECEAVFTQVTDKRWYGKTFATRIQEIDDYARPGEHRLPEGQGGGYLWRLASFMRFEERDGGVYFELEAMALSRDVPLSLRLLVDPIVRRVSRNSLAESLRQTTKAVSEVAAIDSGTSDVASERHHFPPPPIRAATAFGLAAKNP